ncbi:MAG TPA: ferredoxin--NADP reductase [Polyangiaceae bacterium]|jgi:ferredoxin--NADP+ reductase|nr:ferredoxin--NADP reductase [Polyangiaceae bacterium]
MSISPSNLHQETVLEVRHWNDSLFSFKTTRDAGFRFKNGHFVMIGLEVEGKPLLRAYSVASANYEEHLEFYSIKVPDGPLTSRLQHLKPGDQVLVGKKPTGTLVMSHLLPGKRLYLLSTGTGLAPFMSMIRDPETYEQYEHVILAHGVRTTSELGYADYIRHELPQHEYLGEQVQKQLLYYPTVTREAFENQGRLTDLIDTGKLTADVGMPELNPEHDRVMICGNPSMLDELVSRLEARGFREGKSHEAGHYTIERAFVER